MNGGSGTDLLDGGAGDDVLYGDQDADTFVFAIGSGHDTILDFEWGTSGSDKLDLSAFALTSLSDVTALATERNGDTLITLDADTSIKLLGVGIANLHADDIVFT